MYFGHTGIDPDADPDGDGWSNWEEFENGTNPTVFNTPPAPQGFAAYLNPDSTVTLTWRQSPGTVTGYTIWRFDDVLYQSDNITVGPTNRFADTSFINYPLGIIQLRMTYRPTIRMVTRVGVAR